MQSKVVAMLLKAALLQKHKVQRLRILAMVNREVNNMPQHDDDNRSRQLDPEHDTYWQSRGEDERPEDWQEQLEDE
jgi:hypothetical protein